MSKDNNKKQKMIPPIRVTDDIFNNINELRDATGSTYNEVVLEEAKKIYNRGYKFNPDYLKKLLGLYARLTEKNNENNIFEGEIIDIYEPSFNELYRVNRPFVYIHFLTRDGVKSNIGIWGFGNTLKIKEKEYFVEDFIIATRRTCLICGEKLKRVLTSATDPVVNKNYIISSGNKFFRVCEKCFKKDKVERMVLELI